MRVETPHSHRNAGPIDYQEIVHPGGQELSQLIQRRGTCHKRRGIAGVNINQSLADSIQTCDWDNLNLEWRAMAGNGATGRGCRENTRQFSQPELRLGRVA